MASEKVAFFPLMMTCLSLSRLHAFPSLADQQDRAQDGQMFVEVPIAPEGGE